MTAIRACGLLLLVCIIIGMSPAHCSSSDSLAVAWESSYFPRSVRAYNNTLMGISSSLGGFVWEVNQQTLSADQLLVYQDWGVSPVMLAMGEADQRILVAVADSEVSGTDWNVRVYRWEGGSMNLIAHLTNPMGLPTVSFGAGLHFQGEYLFVGCFDIERPSSTRIDGAVFVYAVNSTSVQYVQRLDIWHLELPYSAQMGFKMDGDGDRLIVSGIRDAFLFVHNDTAWQYVQQFWSRSTVSYQNLEQNTFVGDRFFAVGDTTKVVGLETTGGVNVYQWNGSHLDSATTIDPPQAINTEEKFGFTVAYSGRYAVVTAPNHVVGSDTPGLAVTYLVDGSSGPTAVPSFTHLSSTVLEGQAGLGGMAMASNMLFMSAYSKLIGYVFLPVLHLDVASGAVGTVTNADTVVVRLRFYMPPIVNCSVHFNETVRVLVGSSWQSMSTVGGWSAYPLNSENEYSFSFRRPGPLASSALELTLKTCTGGHCGVAYQLPVTAACGQLGVLNLWSSTSTICVGCPTGGICVDGQYPIPAAGFWDSGNLQYLECVPFSACQEGGQCGDGYEGRLCGSCADGYYRDSQDQSCNECSGVDNVLLVFGVLVVGVFGFALYKLITWATGRGVKLYAVEPVIAFLQTVAVLHSVNLDWGWTIGTTMQTASTFAINLDLLKLECMTSSYTFATRYRVALLVPLALVCVAVLVAGLLKCLGKCTNVVRQVPNFLLTMMAFAYLPLLEFTLNMFRCTKQTDGTWVFEAEREKECFGGYWTSMLPYALVSLVVFVLGYPAVLCYVLLGRQPISPYTRDGCCGCRKPAQGWFAPAERSYAAQHVRDMTVGVDYEQWEESFAGLLGAFSPRTFYWSIVVAVRKALVVTISVFVVSDAIPQAVLLVMVLVLSVGLQIVVRPYREGTQMNRLELASLLGTIVLLGFGLVLDGAEDVPGDDSDAVVDALGVIFGCAFIGIAVVVVFLAVLIVRRQVTQADASASLKITGDGDADTGPQALFINTPEEDSSEGEDNVVETDDVAVNDGSESGDDIVLSTP